MDRPRRARHGGRRDARALGKQLDGDRLLLAHAAYVVDAATLGAEVEHRLDVSVCDRVEPRQRALDGLRVGRRAGVVAVGDTGHGHEEGELSPAQVVEAHSVSPQTGHHATA